MKDHVLSRIRAGVLEIVTTNILQDLEIADRLHAKGLPHDGFHLADGERLIRIDIKALTGKEAMVYGQAIFLKKKGSNENYLNNGACNMHLP